MSPRPIVPIQLDAKLIEAFFPKVERRTNDECWPWRGNTNPAGYGQIWIGNGTDRKVYLAHRIAYTIHNKAMPETGKLVLHSCDNPACCNPYHLRAGTYQDNSDDMLARGRSTKGKGKGLSGVRGTAHPRSKYDEAQRTEAYRLYSVEHKTQVWIAAKLGCNRQSVARWIREAEKPRK